MLILVNWFNSNIHKIFGDLYTKIFSIKKFWSQLSFMRKSRVRLRRVRLPVQPVLHVEEGEGAVEGGHEDVGHTEVEEEVVGHTPHSLVSCEQRIMSLDERSHLFRKTEYLYSGLFAAERSIIFAVHSASRQSWSDRSSLTANFSFLLCNRKMLKKYEMIKNVTVLLRFEILFSPS